MKHRDKTEDEKNKIKGRNNRNEDLDDDFETESVEFVDKDDDYYNDEVDEIKVYSNARELRRKKKKVRRRRIIELILFVVLAILLWLNWNVLAPPQLADAVDSLTIGIGNSKYPVSYDQGTLKTAVPMGSNVGILTDTSFLIYSQTGEQLAERPHGFNDPCAVSGGGNVVIFDRGGLQFRVENIFGEPFSETASNDITTAAVGASGSFAIVTQSQDYLSELTVYDSSDKNIFEWNCVQGRILCASISPDGKKLAAIVVGARDGSIFSDVYIFNLNSQTPSIKKFDGEMLFSIGFKDNNNIAAVGEDKTVFLTSDGVQTADYEYGSKQLVCSSNEDSSVILVFGDVDDQSSVVSLDESGKLQGKTSVSGKVNDVSTGGGNIVLVSNGQIWYTSVACTGIKKINVTGYVLAALPIKQFAYVFGTQSIGRYNMD